MLVFEERRKPEYPEENRQFILWLHCSGEGRRGRGRGILHVVVFSFYRSCQLANCSKGKYPGTNNWKQKISKRMVPGLRNKQAKHCMWKAFVYLASYICFWKCVSLTNLGYTTETVFTLNKVHTSTKKNTTLFAQGKNKMTLKKNKIIKCQVLVSGFRFLKEIGYNYLWSHAVENWKKKDYKIQRTTRWNLDLTRPSV